MARVATKDTYGMEQIGNVKIRRQYKAGAPVPETIDVPAGAVEDTEEKGLPGYREGTVTKRLKAGRNGTYEMEREVEKTKRTSSAADRPRPADEDAAHDHARSRVIQGAEPQTIGTPGADDEKKDEEKPEHSAPHARRTRRAKADDDE